MIDAINNKKFDYWNYNYTFNNWLKQYCIHILFSGVIC